MTVTMDTHIQHMLIYNNIMEAFKVMQTHIIYPLTTRYNMIIGYMYLMTQTCMTVTMDTTYVYGNTQSHVDIHFIRLYSLHEDPTFCIRFILHTGSGCLPRSHDNE